MFRYTGTFLVIFLILNHEFAAARNIENIASDGVKETKGAPDMEFEKTYSEQQSEITRPHSRQKRKWGRLVAKGLGLIAAGSFGFSIGTTAYQAIQSCKDFRPDPCKSPSCTYLSSCPDVCHGPETNRNYIKKEKENVKKRLDLLDQIQTNAFNLATKAVSAGLNNRWILTQIKGINAKVNQLMLDLVDLDIDLATKFRNQSVKLKSMLRNERLTLGEIIASPEMDSIFDKWTWEGTGVFVLTLALPLGLKFYSYMKEKIAINKLYKEMRVDFTQRFITQKIVNPNAPTLSRHNKRLHKIAGYSTKEINSQVKYTAKTTYKAQRGNREVTRTEKFVNKVLGPVVNIIVTLMAAWQFYQFYDACQTVADDLHDTAVNITNQRNRIEKMKVTKIDPLFASIKEESWGAVRKLLTNETMSDWLLGIRNVSLGAANPNLTTAGSIEYFLDNIGGAGVDKTIALQKKLISALESVEFEFGCYSDKQHAITLVIKDCRKGRAPLDELYKDADSKYKLNRGRCVDSKKVPYTTLEQFEKIVASFSAKQGWYHNCLLNNNDLLIRVCDKRLKGYVTPEAIIQQINKTGLTVDIVTHFTSRCPPPKITPKARTETCKLYCLYLNVSQIKQSVQLLKSQVQEIISNCPICSARPDQQTTICYLHFCKEQNASTIEPKVRLPMPSVNHVINNLCTPKCVVNDAQKRDICDKSKCKGYRAKKIAAFFGLPLGTINEVIRNCHTILPTPKCVVNDAQKRDVCDRFKCKGYTARKIAASVGLPSATINEVIRNCHTILPSCSVSKEDRDNVLFMHCNFETSAKTIYKRRLVKLPLSTIRKIIASTPCSVYNG